MSLREVARDALLVGGKDAKQLFRSPLLVATLAFGPLFLMILLGFVFPNVSAIQDVPLGLVSEDAPVNGESEADAFFAKFREANARTGSFDLVTYATRADARRAVDSGELQAFLLVPDGFTDARRHGGYQAEVVIHYDQTNPALGRQIVSTARTLVSTVSAEEGAANVRDATRLGSTEAVRAFMDPYASNAVPVSGASPSYAQFLIPGLMMMIVMSTVLLGLPNAVSRERQLGTLDAIMASPVTRAGFLLGKIVGVSVRGAVQITLIVALSMIFFGVRFQGNFLLVLALILICLFAFAGFGLAIVSLMTSDESPGPGALMIVLPMMLLSGVMFPIQQLPGWVQVVSHFLPLTYGVRALRSVIITGAGLGSVIPEILILLLFGAAGLVLAVRAYKRLSRRVAS